MSTAAGPEPRYHGSYSVRITETDATCMNGDPHEPHQWVYISEGGGHMVRVGEREWRCPGRTVQADLPPLQPDIGLLRPGSQRDRLEALLSKPDPTEADVREAAALLPEPEEVALARDHARRAEALARRGQWDEGTYHASMATMYLAIATWKENRRGQD